MDLDSSVGIVTRYGPDGGEMRFSVPVHTGPGAQPPIQCVPGLSQVEGGRKVALTTKIHLDSRVKKE